MKWNKKQKQTNGFELYEIDAILVFRKTQAGNHNTSACFPGMHCGPRISKHRRVTVGQTRNREANVVSQNSEIWQTLYFRKKDRVSINNRFISPYYYVILFIYLSIARDILATRLSSLEILEVKLIFNT